MIISLDTENVVVRGRGGHQHWQVGRMPDTYPTFDRKEWKIVLFQKPEIKDRALYSDICQSLTLTISRDQIFHFQGKKTSRPISRLFQLSKVVSINLPILAF